MSDAAQTTALQVAHRVRDGMWARDNACQALGMRILGETLTASAHEVSKAGRTGIDHVDVGNQNGVRIAVFRGRSHTFRGRSAVPQVQA